MEINLECSDIIQDEFSQFLDNNSQICLNEESFMFMKNGDTPMGNTSISNKLKLLSTLGKNELQEIQSIRQSTKAIQNQQVFDFNSNYNSNCGKGVQVLQDQMEMSAIVSQVNLHEIVLQVDNKKQEEASQPVDQSQSDQNEDLKIKELEEKAEITSMPKPMNQNAGWQKVSFNKRRPSNNLGAGSNQPKPLQRMQSLKNNEGQFNKQTPAQIQQKKNDEIKRKLSAVRDPSEPLPVFDCLFCCQEHFVLQKINDQINVNKYSKTVKYFEEPRDTMLFMLRLEELKTLCNDQSQPLSTSAITNYQESLQIIDNSGFENQKPKPTIIKLITVQKKPQTEQKSKNYNMPLNKSAIQRQEELEKKKKEQERKIMQENFFGMSCQNISAIDESNFGNINLRTRRQKVLQNISFESEYHNIYDPMYTSQEEDSSVNLYDSEEESEEEYDEESEYEDYEDDKTKNNEEEQVTISPNSIKNAQYLQGVEEDNRCSISSINQSSIQQQTDDDDEGFTGIDDDNSAINKQLPSHSVSNNLNIQENPMPSNDQPLQDEDEDSERYTFGCITPKGEEAELGDLLDQQKITFSNCHGETSLSPVRAVNNKQEEKKIMQISPSTQKNAKLLEISPLCYTRGVNNIQIRFDGKIAQGEVEDINSLRKIDFYPSQDQESIELQQQKSYDASDILISMPALKAIDESRLILSQENQKELLIASNDSQFSSSPGSEEEQYDTTSQIQTQCYRNNDFIQTDSNLDHPNGILFPLNMQPQSQSFTTTGFKYKHQKLLPQAKINLEKDQSNITMESSKKNRQFLLKQEQVNELLKKARQIKSSQGNNHHLTSFDSALNNKPNQFSNSKEQLRQQQLSNPKKQKTQAICTPIDTTDVYSTQASKPNKTTVLQNSRRQNGTLASCKNKGSSTNLLLNAQDSQTFRAKVQQEFNSTKNIVTKGKKAKNLETLQFQESQALKTVSSTTSKNQPTLKSQQLVQQLQQQQLLGPQLASPSIIKNQDKKQSFVSQQMAQLNNLTKKDINQFLRSALCSSRYSSQSGATNFLFKHQTSMDYTQQEGSKSKKKKKVKGSKVNEKKSNNKSLKKKKKKQMPTEYYQQQADFNNFLNQNVCNSINFSNDYSIPSVIAGHLHLTHKSNSSQSHAHNKNNQSSSQNTLMYLSMQDPNQSKHIFSNQPTFYQNCQTNSTNIQDTSNNYPYGSTIQAEMSTCISNGHNITSKQISLDNQLLQQQSLSNRRKNQIKNQQEGGQKLNGSIEEPSLYNILTSLTVQQKKRQDFNESGFNVLNQGKQSSRGSISIQRSQNAMSVLGFAQSTDQPQNLISQEGFNQIQKNHHQGQFSFSQNTSNLKLNLTGMGGSHARVNNGHELNLHEKKRKSKQNNNSTNMFVNNLNTIQSSQTVKSTQQQPSRRDNNQQHRTRSNSKSNHVIKADAPTHQLLLSNQIQNQPVLIKNKQILLAQPNASSLSKQGTSFTKTNGLNTVNTSQNKSQLNSTIATAQKKQKLLLISSEQHSKILHTHDSGNGSQPHSQTRIQNSISAKQANKNQSYQTHQQSFQDKLYGTGKFMMSHVTSPMRSNGSKVAFGNTIQQVASKQSMHGNLVNKGETIFATNSNEKK